MHKDIKYLIEGKAPVREIKDALEHIDFDSIEVQAHHLLSDPRKSVVTLGEQLLKKRDRLLTERKRMEKMFEFESNLQSKGFVHIAGVDEVGRGPLIGPVVAGAVILDLSKDWSGINDSKKLSEEKRAFFYEKIINEAVAFAVGFSSHETIDEVNILNATKLAMKEAVDQIEADFLLIDAVKLTDISIEQMAIVKGDLKSASIAAASILAKVTRDRYMMKLHAQYPMYDFINNKGYGTPSHYRAIEQFGLLPEHRRSFLKTMI